MDDDLAHRVRALDEQAAGDDERATGQLQRYLDLLSKWNRTYNLTAITGREQMVTHHLLDSLSIVEPIDQVLGARAEPRILDVGTGAGLPGIALAVVRPRWQVTMLDSIGKKIAFVTQVIAELGLVNATAVAARVENFRGEANDVIVSRAYASLRDFTAQTRHLLAPGGVWAAMKGTHPAAELRELHPDIECIGALPISVSGLDAARHLILLKVKR